MEKETFILETENGCISCEVILRFYFEKYQKNYIVYTEHSKNEDQEENIFVSSYQPDDESHTLEDIKNPEELQDIVTQLEKWENNL